VRDAVEAALAGLDDGSLRVAEKTAAGWQVHQWLKKAVLMSFLRLTDMAPMPGGPGGGHWYDKVPSKFEGWDAKRFAAAGFRVVPPAAVRRGALYRARRRRDAELRQSRRLCRQGHHGRYLGDRRLVRADR